MTAPLNPAALARFDSPQPVPVAERLPTAADSDAEGRCWWFDANDGWLWLSWSEAFHWGAITHWLPASALPIPGAKP